MKPLKIFHLADIHIGSSIKRSAEYHIIFDKLATTITTIMQDTTYEYVVIIAGDIFHNKTRYSGEDISDFNYLMSRLNMLPVVIIPGNHDCNMNNPTGTDLLTPLSFPNLQYWKDSGDFTLCGQSFYHVSVRERAAPPIATLCDKILLFHGMVNGAKFGTFVHHESIITLDIMRKCTLVLLGDIHEHSFILPNAAYPGSLIQQNRGESRHKGIIVWDVAARNGQFVPIENDYGFLQIDTRITDAVIDAPKYVLGISIIGDPTSEFIADVEAKYGRVDKISCAPLQFNPNEEVLGALEQVLRIQNVREDYRADILATHAAGMQMITHSRWYVTELRWDNLFKYGTDNYIDFTRINGVTTGVIAPNMSGKSSIIDVLVYGLYGIFLRGTKESAIRDGAQTFSVKVDFVVNDVYYHVERTDSRRHARPDIQLTRCDDVDVPTWTNITADNITKTYACIAELIGSLSQLLSSGIYYDHDHDIARMNDRDRKNTLTKMFGIVDPAAFCEQLKRDRAEIKTKIAAQLRPTRTDPHADKIQCVDALDNYYAEHQKLSADLEIMNHKLAAALSARPTAIIEREIAEIRQRIDALGQIARVEPCGAQVTTPTAAQLRKWRECKYTGENSSSLRAKISLMEKNIPANLHNFNEEKVRQNIATAKKKLAAIVIIAPTSTETAETEQLAAEIARAEQEIDKYRRDLLPIIQCESMAAATAITFNDECASCSANKIILAAELHTLECNFAAARQENMVAQQHNDIIAAQIDELRARVAALQCRLTNAYQRDRETKQRLENIIARDKIVADIARWQELLDLYLTHNINLANITQEKLHLAAAIEYETATAGISAYENGQATLRYNTYLQASQKHAAATISLTQLAAELTRAKECKSDMAAHFRAETKKLSATLLEIGAAIALGEHNLTTIEQDCAALAQYEVNFPPLSERLSKIEAHLAALTHKSFITIINSGCVNKLVAHVNDFLAAVTDFKIREKIDADRIDFNLEEAGALRPISLASGYQRFIISVAVRLAFAIILPSRAEFIIIDEGFGSMDPDNVRKLTPLFATIAPLYKFTFIISHNDEIQNIIGRPLAIGTKEEKWGQCSHIYDGIVAVKTDPMITVNAITNAIIVEEIAKKRPREDPDAKFRCPCGAEMKNSSRREHMKTPRHRRRMKELGLDD